jgi:drug/metabolite transporter (DMT)-like permease
LFVASFVEGASFAIPDSQTWIVLVAYGICGQVLGWVLITRGLKGLTAAHIGLILLLQPTLSFAWDLLFFNRPTLLVEVVGAAIALAAIYLGNTRALKKRDDKAVQVQ